MRQLRYELTRDLDGYTVYDVFTGWPVRVNGECAVGLSGDDAQDLMDRLSEGNFKLQSKLRISLASRCRGQGVAIAPTKGPTDEI